MDQAERICRPVGLTPEDRSKVIRYAVERIGYDYDLKNIIDLMRYFLPHPPVPVSWRRRMIALGSGGLVGKGPGNVPVGRRVPEAHNDMVFCLIGEQFGFLGTLFVVGAYLVLFAAGVEIAAATREPFGRLVALGTVAVLAGQTFINLAVVTRLMVDSCMPTAAAISFSTSGFR